MPVLHQSESASSDSQFHYCSDVFSMEKDGPKDIEFPSTGPISLGYLSDNGGSILVIVMAGELWRHQVPTYSICFKHGRATTDPSAKAKETATIHFISLTLPTISLLFHRVGGKGSGTLPQSFSSMWPFT